jgi:hypothetical protein
MKFTSHIFAWIWMVLVLNTMFQSCFQTLDIAGDDPVNSLSELVMESFFDGGQTTWHKLAQPNLYRSGSKAPRHVNKRVVGSCFFSKC